MQEISNYVNLANSFPKSYSEGFRLDKVAKLAFPIIALVSGLALGGAIAAVVLIPGSGLAIAAMVISSVFMTIVILSKIASTFYYHFPQKLQRIIDVIDANFREALATLAFTFTYFLPATLFERIPETPNYSRIVLATHGFLHNSSCWHYSKHRLESHVAPIHTVNLGHPFQSIENYVLYVAERIGELVPENGFLELDLIGHSMGGVVNSYLAEHIHDLSELLDKFEDAEHKIRLSKVSEILKRVNVRKAVTIASPLKGTETATTLKIFTTHMECAKQMEKDSLLTQNLHNKFHTSEKPIQYLHFGCTEDLIVPIESCFVEKENHTNVTLEGKGHLWCMFSDDMYDQMIQFFTT